MHLLNCFDEYELKHIFRENNDRANILSKLVSSKKPRQHRTFIQETFTTPSIDRCPNLPHNGTTKENKRRRLLKKKMSWSCH